MGRIKDITSLVETKFISLYNVKYLNKSNKEKEKKKEEKHLVGAGLQF